MPMDYFGILFLCFALVSGSFSNEDIHNYMTPEEVQQLFNTDHSSVPKYEVVKVHLSKRLHKRIVSNEIPMYVRVFDQDINLWLHPGDSFLAGRDTPVYFAKYSSKCSTGVEYTLQDGLMNEVGEIFEDPEMQASFVIGKEELGCSSVNGYIGSKKIAVRSLPPRVAQEYRRRRRSVGDSDDLDSPYHLVFEAANMYGKNYESIPVNVTSLRERASRSTQEIPDTLYPEILSVVEYTMYRTYEDDIYSLLGYLLAYWNGVDLKYRSLESPRIRFSISAIILSIDPRATPYISDNSMGNYTFNSTAAMTSVAEFYYAVKDTFPLDSYDIAATITRQKFGNGRMGQIIGKSYVGGACFHNDTEETTRNVVLIRDNGAFEGIIFTAHELGHQLGSRHDDKGKDCDLESGFLMSYTPWYTKNSSDFSRCSRTEFDVKLNKSQLECLYNRPKYAGRSIPKLMPGRVKSMAEQCQAMGFITTCVIRPTHGLFGGLRNIFSRPIRPHFDPCTSIWCVNKIGNCVKTGVAAIDGSTCGKNGEFCLHMQCVKL